MAEDAVTGALGTPVFKPVQTLRGIYTQLVANGSLGEDDRALMDRAVGELEVIDQDINSYINTVVTNRLAGKDAPVAITEDTLKAAVDAGLLHAVGFDTPEPEAAKPAVGDGGEPPAA